MSEIVDKAWIERLARQAAAEGVPIRDACPYPFSSPAGQHFVAVYALAKPKSGEQHEPLAPHR